MILIGAATAAVSAQVPDTNPLGNSAEVVAAGALIYRSSCTVCHGQDGEAGDRAPALAAARSYVRRTDAELFDSIKNGIAGTGMPATGLDDDDSWRVVAYIRSLRATASDFPPNGDVKAGADLFWGKAECGECHMIRGRGGLVGPDLTDLGQRLSLKALREALTTERLRASVGYEPAVIRTTSGETLEGVLKNRHNFSYQLLDGEGRLHMLSADEVAEAQLSGKALMPGDLDKRLTADEFRDLLAFLSRLAR